MSKKQGGDTLGTIGIVVVSLIVAVVAKFSFGILSFPGQPQVTSASAEVTELAEIIYGIPMSAYDSAAMRRMEQAATAAGVPTDQLELYTAGLTQRGMARLPDDLLLERASLLLSASRRLDVETCGRIALTSVHDRGLGLRMMEAFTPEERQRWLRLSMIAGTSEIDQSSPRLELTVAEAEHLWLVISDVLTDAEFALMMALEEPETLSYRDLCDVQILLLSAPERLPERERRLLARWLATAH